MRTTILEDVMDKNTFSYNNSTAKEMRENISQLMQVLIKYDVPTFSCQYKVFYCVV